MSKRPSFMRKTYRLNGATARAPQGNTGCFALRGSQPPPPDTPNSSTVGVGSGASVFGGATSWVGVAVRVGVAVGVKVRVLAAGVVGDGEGVQVKVGVTVGADVLVGINTVAVGGSVNVNVGIAVGGGTQVFVGGTYCPGVETGPPKIGVFV